MRVNRLVFVLTCLCLVLPSTRATGDAASPCVVLLHGMVRTAKSMKGMARELRKSGFIVQNVDYPSRKYTVHTLSELAVEEGFSRCAAVSRQPPAFVTHSLGGILLRYYLSRNPVKRVSRVVMLGPPNQGSEVVDRLKDMPGFAVVNGPVGRTLGTGDKDLPRSLGPVTFELGIIAGTRTVNPVLSIWLPNPDDGKVSVQSARVDGMCDFIEMPVTHAFMMRNKHVIRQTISFLNTGRFEREEEMTGRLCD